MGNLVSNRSKSDFQTVANAGAVFDSGVFWTAVCVELDYFRIHYKERIIENGIECRDMIRMEMILDAK